MHITVQYAKLYSIQRVNKISHAATGVLVNYCPTESLLYSVNSVDPGPVEAG